MIKDKSYSTCDLSCLYVWVGFKKLIKREKINTPEKERHKIKWRTGDTSLSWGHCLALSSCVVCINNFKINWNYFLWIEFSIFRQLKQKLSTCNLCATRSISFRSNIFHVFAVIYLYIHKSTTHLNVDSSLSFAYPIHTWISKRRWPYNYNIKHNSPSSN